MAPLSPYGAREPRSDVVEYTQLTSKLPLKIPIRSSRVGVQSERRLSWLREQEDASAQQRGWLLLSARQLRQRIGGESTAVSMEEAFRVTLYRWPLKDGTAELTVTVGQMGSRVRFGVVLPAHCLPDAPELPLQESTAPLMSADDFAALWPALITLSRAHGRAPLPELDLEARHKPVLLDRSLLLPQPTRQSFYLMSADPEALSLRLDMLTVNVWLGMGRLLCMVLMAYSVFALIESAPLWPVLFMVVLAVFCVSGVNSRLGSLLRGAHLEVDHERLVVRYGLLWFKSDVELPVWRLKQFFITIDEEKQRRQHASTLPIVVGALEVLMDDESSVKLLPIYHNPSDGQYLESVLEMYLDIHNKPVAGEWRPNQPREYGTAYIGCRM